MKKIFFAIAVSFTWTMASSQNVGVGTTTPVEKLDVVGNIKTTGEIKPNGTTGQVGQVLTSNGNGTMQWAGAKVASGNGNGGWGDCSIYNIDSLVIASHTNAQSGDNLGVSAAISGNYAIAGAYFDDEAPSNSGSATIYKFNAGTGNWDIHQKLVNPNAAADDYFGYAVAISGDYAIVGAYGDDDAASSSGSVTIFKRNIATDVWESQGKIVNPTPAAGDNFGTTVSISGDYAVVGAATDDESGFTDNGSVTILKRNTITGIWENQGKLYNNSPENNDNFGYSVSISGDYLVVGAWFDNEDGVGDCGSITFFKRNGAGVWVSQGKMVKPNKSLGDRFGAAVRINGDYAIAGVPYDDDKGTNTGAAIIYKRNTVSDTWELVDKIYDPRPGDSDLFGVSIAIASNYAMVGNHYDDESGGTDNGSVSIFKRIESTWFTHQKFTTPGANIDANHFGQAVALDNNNRFLVGAPLLSGRGMVFFGTVK